MKAILPSTFNRWMPGCPLCPQLGLGKALWTLLVPLARLAFRLAVWSSPLLIWAGGLAGSGAAAWCIAFAARRSLQVWRLRPAAASPHRHACWHAQINLLLPALLPLPSTRCVQAPSM